MKKIVLGFLSFIAILIFTGCAVDNLGTAEKSVPLKLYRMPVKNMQLKGNNIDFYVKNGSLIKNDKKIFDENGDIVYAFKIDNKIYYVLKCNNNLYEIKNLNSKKIVKKLVGNSVRVFTDGNNRAVIALRFNNNNSYVYDNIYLFDNKGLTLINKNLNLGSPYYRVDNMFIFFPVTQNGETTYNYGPFNVLSGKFIDPKCLYSTKWLGIPVSNYNLIGVAGNNLIYSYDGSKGILLSAINGETGKIYTLLSYKKTKNLLIFFKSGKTIVLKILNNPKLKDESYLAPENLKSRTKYAKLPGKYIDLNTLEEYRSIDSSFTPITIPLYYTSVTGKRLPHAYYSYSLDTINMTEWNQLIF